MVKERDARLRTTINFTTGASRILLSFDTIPGKKKQKFNLLPKYCPFCGEEYPDINPFYKGEEKEDGTQHPKGRVRVMKNLRLKRR